MAYALPDEARIAAAAGAEKRRKENPRGRTAKDDGARALCPCHDQLRLWCVLFGPVLRSGFWLGDGRARRMSYNSLGCDGLGDELAGLSSGGLMKFFSAGGAVPQASGKGLTE